MKEVGFHHCQNVWPASSYFWNVPLVVTIEKRTVSYLSVSALIRVIDPFSQMKRDYGSMYGA